jgi:hypothetical protein
MVKLPADLVVYGFWPVRVGKACGFDGVSGGTERVSAHMADGDGLTGGARSGRCGGSPYITCTDAAGKSTADLVGSI